MMYAAISTISERALEPQVAELISVFNRLFFKRYNTCLVPGEHEPIYLPAGCQSASVGAQDFHQIVFAHGYFSSALHEVAHWCIAGEARRQQEDYGYWYCPDGRDAQQQQAFETVEVKPQAIEWAMTVAANRRFQVSTDNLNGVEPDRADFTRRVRAQLVMFLHRGFPPRAQAFIDALYRHFNGPALTLPYLVKDYPGV